MCFLVGEGEGVGIENPDLDRPYQSLRVIELSVIEVESLLSSQLRLSGFFSLSDATSSYDIGFILPKLLTGIHTHIHTFLREVTYLWTDFPEHFIKMQSVVV